MEFLAQANRTIKINHARHRFGFEGPLAGQEMGIGPVVRGRTGCRGGLRVRTVSVSRQCSGTMRLWLVRFNRRSCRQSSTSGDLLADLHDKPVRSAVVIPLVAQPIPMRKVPRWWR